MKPNETLYAGEAQFAGWSDSHTQGPIIKIRLPSSDDLDKFRALTAAKGKQAGHIFEIAIVERGDDGQPVPPPEGTKATDPKFDNTVSFASSGGHKQTVGPYCREAVELCENADFQKWLESESGVPVRSAEAAKKGLLAILGIGSRKEIDTDESVKEAFIENIRVPFMHWQRGFQGDQG